jgi:hypothetical protein
LDTQPLAFCLTLDFFHIPHNYLIWVPMLDSPEHFTRDNVKSMGNFTRLDRKSLRRQQRKSSEETPGIVYEKGEGVKLVTVESHVKVRIVSPVEFPVDLRSGERKK